MSAAVSSPTTAPGPARTPAIAWWLPLAVCLANTGAWLVAMVSVRGRLPDPVATHWGVGTAPDGFSSVASTLLVDAVMSLVFPLLLLGLGVALKVARPMAATAAGVGVMMGLILFGSAWHQRGLQDAHQARNTGWDLPIGLVAGLVVGVLVWLAVRDRTADADASAGLPAGSATVPVPSAARIAWTGTTRHGRGLWFVLALGVLPTLVMGGLAFATRQWGFGVGLLLTTALIAVSLGCLRCHVTIDQRGLRAVGLGIPWVRVPLAAVEHASVEHGVTPLGDYGGWGMRSRLDGSGGWGLVTAAGEALRVARAGKGDMVVTVDDAERAAAVLNTLVARRQQGDNRARQEER